MGELTRPYLKVSKNSPITMRKQNHCLWSLHPETKNYLGPCITVNSVPASTESALSPRAEQTMEELVELLVARIFTNKQETLAAETRVMKTYGEAGMGREKPKEGFPGLAASESSLLEFRHSPPYGSGVTLQSHLKQASPFAQESSLS